MLNTAGAIAALLTRAFAAPAFVGRRHYIADDIMQTHGPIAALLLDKEDKYPVLR